MSIKQKLAELKEFLLAEESTETTLAQMSLEDGTVIEAENFEAGQGVFIVNEEDRIPLPVGEYNLAAAEGEAAMKLVVEEEGVIASIGAMEEEVVEEEMEKETPAEFVTVDQFNEAIESIKSMLSSIESKDKELEELSSQKEELEAKTVELEDQLKQPAVEPLKKAPSNTETKLAKSAYGRLVQKIQNINE